MTQGRTQTTHLPDYAERLDLQHRIFDSELHRIVGESGGDSLGLAQRVYDFGCGAGFFTRVLAEHTSARRVVGLDASDEFLDVARDRTPAALRGRVTFARRDFVESTSGLEPADVSFCADSFRSIDPDALLDALRSTTKPGGRILLTEVDPIQSIRTSAEPEAHDALETASRRKGQPDRGFVRSARTWLLRAGFEEVDVRSYALYRAAPFGRATRRWLELEFQNRLQQLESSLTKDEGQTARRSFDAESPTYFARDSRAWFLLTRIGVSARVAER